MQAIRDAVRIERQVDVRPDAVPADILAPDVRAAEARMSLAEGDHPLREAMMVGMSFEARDAEKLAADRLLAVPYGSRGSSLNESEN
jgi:hypothetical protein